MDEVLIRILFLSLGLISPLDCVTNNDLYKGHKLLRIYPDTDEHLEHIREITNRSDQQVRYWDDDASSTDDHKILPSLIDILSTENAYAKLVTSLLERGLPYDIVSDDVQNDLNQHMERNFRAKVADEYYFRSYHPLDEIFSFLELLVGRCGGRCETVDIGTSYEGRPLRAIKITGPTSSQAKKKLWIDAGIHAREWISHATAQFIIERLVEDYDRDDSVRALVDKYEWYILPCINPDGYNFTWETDRLWRKTRRPNPDTFCVGTDANRNFGFHWGDVGVSQDPCANNYRGPSPLSEPEARALSDYILAGKGDWLLYLSLHSKGQLIMAPWGYTDRRPKDFGDLEKFGTAIKDGIYFTHGKNYTFGAASTVLYKSSGTSRDWARGVAGVKYVYTMELRDRGQYGWLLPPDQILPTGQEVWAGITAALGGLTD